MTAVDSKKKGGSQQWDDKLIGRESRRQFGNSSLGPEPKVVAGFHYLLSGKRAEASETGQSARFCHSQPDAVVPLLPSVSTVDLSGLWLIRLWYLASTSCRRNSSVWDGIDHSLKYTYGHHRCRRLLPSDSWGWPEGFGGETRPVCWKRRGCLPGTSRRTWNCCTSRRRSLAWSARASLLPRPGSRHLCCSLRGHRNPPGPNILLRALGEQF